jgi:hypothetical protein
MSAIGKDRKNKQIGKKNRQHTKDGRADDRENE